MYSSICTFTVVWLLPILTYTLIEHAEKSTCLFNAGICQPMCIPSLMHAFVVWIFNRRIGIIDVWFVTFHSCKTTKKNWSFYDVWHDSPFFEIRVVQQSVNALKTDILYLANNYYRNYRPSLSALKKNTRY